MEKNDYEVKWLIENKVVLYIQNIDTTLENVENMISAINEIMASSPHEKIPVIADVKNVKGNRIPIGGVTQRFRTTRSDKWGFTIVVGAQGIVNFLAQLLFQLARIEVRFATDIQDALNILGRIYPDLPPYSEE